MIGGRQRWVEMSRDGQRWLEMSRGGYRQVKVGIDGQRWVEVGRDGHRQVGMGIDRQRLAQMIGGRQRWVEMSRDVQRWVEIGRDDQRWVEIGVEMGRDRYYCIALRQAEIGHLYLSHLRQVPSFAPYLVQRTPRFIAIPKFESRVAILSPVHRLQMGCKMISLCCFIITLWTLKHLTNNGLEV